MTTTTRKAPARKPQVTVVPAAAKQPQDRKPKADDVEQTEQERIQALADTAVTAQVDGGTKVTLCGFSVVIPDGANDDFELLAEVGQMDAKYARGAVIPALTHFAPILRSLAGEAGYKEAMNALRGENGRVRVEPAIDYVNALLLVMRISADEED